MARLWANLKGPAKEIFRMCKPQEFEDARGVERLLRFLRESPLASMPVPDAYEKIQAYDQIRRRPGEVIGDYIVREQRAFREMTEAFRRVRNSRNEKTGARRHDHQVTCGNSSVYSEAEYEMVEDEDTFIEAPWRQDTHFAGCAVTFNKDTLHSDITLKSISLHDNRNGEGQSGWVLQAVFSRASFCRVPRNGKSYFTMMSLHISNPCAKNAELRRTCFLQSVM